ncbi:hypothetical protein E5676_scaffold333G001030 [Cucumis melo var. makuwa]|uniref:DUF4283 domain-containing protein n=1 Tax=Cucumis melo var. makuwa TaxID=1194695 RepID=A0A5A7U6A9_CUCMM|nr:hypothetical protein E6C27_scaffold55G001850 [Cucumis melo var. makuwa]TYK22220.1 hypothetical protein E5676_scaffold333G001030 [Cucumis melo var. makuwa]
MRRKLSYVEMTKSSLSNSPTSRSKSNEIGQIPSQNRKLQVPNHSSPSKQKQWLIKNWSCEGYGGWLKIKNLPLDYWCRSTLEVIENHFGGLTDRASETLNLTNITEAWIQVKKNLCGFVPPTIEITDLKRKNIYLHFGDFEFLNPTGPSKVPSLWDDFNNSIDCLRVRDVLLDEDIDPSSFPSIPKVPKSVFAVLPRGRNPYEILKKFPAIPSAPKKKTAADIQFKGELITQASEQAPNLNFAKTKTNSCCKKAMESTSINLAFKILTLFGFIPSSTPFPIKTRIYWKYTALKFGPLNASLGSPSKADYSFKNQLDISSPFTVSSEESAGAFSAFDLKLDSEIEGVNLNALFNDEGFSPNKVPMDLPKDLLPIVNDCGITLA